MIVRRARPEDAAQAADVIRRSIAELCRAEYRDDPEVLARWLSNKTPEDLARWIADPAGVVCVVVGEDGAIAAVGSAGEDGTIHLNYVAPEARFRGAGKALIAWLEDWLRGRGVAVAQLSSTGVARRLYLSLGFEEGRRVPSRFGTVDGYEMRKRL